MASVSAQTFTDCEHIIISDGHNPESEAVCKLYSGKYLTTGIKKGNWGADARNLGIIHASGNYLMFLDDDNLLYPWALQNLQELALKNNNPPLLAQRIHYYKRWDGGWIVHPMVMPPTFPCWDNLNACIRSDIAKLVGFGKHYEHDLTYIKDCMGICNTEPILTDNIGGVHL